MKLPVPLRMAAVALLLPALQLLPANAVAASVDCGEYHANEGDARLILDDTRNARLIGPSSAPTRLHYRQENGRLSTFDLDAGYSSEYSLHDGGRRLVTEFGDAYTLAQPQTCANPPPPAPGSCRADPAGCSEKLYDADDATVQRWCDEDLPFACVALIKRYQQQAEQQPRPADIPDIPDIPPPVCREGDPQFSETGCSSLVQELMAKMLADTMQSIYTDSVPLPAARLDEVAALCRRQPSAVVCAEAADKLWDGDRQGAARDALALACDRGQDPNACRNVAPLRGLSPAQLTPVPAQALPCGDYVAETGLMDTLSFGDHGLVEGGFGARLRARLEGGAIRIRHDKGGDFVLRPLPDGRLIGQDSWNRYTLYRRQSGAAHCAAPLAFNEVPLVADCPASSDPAVALACCERGSAHGCNTVGNHMALTGDWKSARLRYRAVCAQGVRVGCENLVQVFANGSDEGAIEDLQAMCGQDPRHIACDVLETSNLPLLGLGHALERAAEELERQSEAED